MYKLSLVAAALVAATLLFQPRAFDTQVSAAHAAPWLKGKRHKGGKMGKMRKKGKMGKMGKMGKGKLKGPHCFNRCVAKGKDPKRCQVRCS